MEIRLLPLEMPAFHCLALSLVLLAVTHRARRSPTAAILLVVFGLFTLARKCTHFMFTKHEFILPTDLIMISLREAIDSFDEVTLCLD